MKKLFSLLFLIAIVALANAQSTTPRFGTAKNDDNTGRVLTYKFFAVTDAAGADSIVAVPRAWQTNYRVSLTDSLTFKQPNITYSYAGDNIRIIASGASGTKVKFYGTYWQSAGTATLGSTGKAIIEFVFDGTNWIEAGRYVQ